MIQSMEQKNQQAPSSTSGARMLRVAQVVGSFGGGGAERMAYNTALGLASLGHESICIALRSLGGYAAQNTIPAISIGAGGGLIGNLRGVAGFRDEVEGARLDVIHVHGTGSLVFVAAALAGVRPRPRLCFTWHDSGSVLEGRGLSRRRMIWALRRCDRVFASCRSVANRLELALGWTDGTARVLRNGVPRCEPAERSNAEPVMAWMGRIVPDKDPQILVRVSAQLRDAGLRFRVVLAGSAPPPQKWYLEQTQRMIDELSLTGIVSLRGWVDDAQSVLREADICVQTSHTEGLSMTLLEGMMASACPIATDVGDTSAAIEHDRTGLLVPERNEEELRSALARVLRDRELRERLGRAAGARARDEFTLEAAGERVVRLYGEALAR